MRSVLGIVAVLIGSLLVAAGCGDSDGSGGGGGGSGGSGGAGCTTLPETVDTDLSVGPGCVDVYRTAVVSGATLTVAAGTTLRFQQGGYLNVGYLDAGVLTAQGTAEKPITFTSRAASPAAGEWGCVFLGGADGSVLEHVNLRYGGADCAVNGSGHTAELVVAGTVRTIASVDARDSAGNGVSILFTGKIVQLLHDATFGTNAQASLKVSAAALTSLGSPLSFEAAETILVDPGFALSESGTIPAAPVPYEVPGQLDINGGAQVTFAPGVTMAFAGSGIDVFGAQITVAGTAEAPVTFTSANASPAAGDWGCVLLESPDKAQSIHGAVFEYAGAGCGGANLHTALGGVNGLTSLQDLTFRHVAGDAITSQFGQCDDGWCAATFEDVSGEAVVCTGGTNPTCG